ARRPRALARLDAPGPPRPGGRLRGPVRRTLVRGAEAPEGTRSPSRPDGGRRPPQTAAALTTPFDEGPYSGVCGGLFLTSGEAAPSRTTTSATTTATTVATTTTPTTAPTTSSTMTPTMVAGAAGTVDDRGQRLTARR